MEKRKAKVIIGAAGGTAHKDSKTYKVSLPSAWIKELGINGDKRDVELIFDGEKIVLKPVKTIEEFKKDKFDMGHEVKEIKFFDKNGLCTCIYADFTDKTLAAENHTDNIVKTAFGNNSCPDWNDFLGFLEERCLPKSRAGIREYLEAIGVSEYDPMEIIKKTAGRMAEDDQWIEMEDVK